MLHFLQRLLHRGERAPDVGVRAEAAAAAWLKRERGFLVLVSNWRNPRDQREELDLVCRDGDVLVFVEVKARAAGALVPGYYAVDARKKRVLLRATRAYLARLHPKPRTFRLDIVEVSLHPVPSVRLANATDKAEAAAEFEIRHFENVPLFSKSFRG